MRGLIYDGMKYYLEEVDTNRITIEVQRNITNVKNEEIVVMLRSWKNIIAYRRILEEWRGVGFKTKFPVPRLVSKSAEGGTGDN